MSLVEELQSWRDPAMWDEPPTEEQVLSQFAYSLISDFIEEPTLVNLLVNDEDGHDLDVLISGWLDRRSPASAR